MKDRPIIFSGPMVRAILDGRKTQTRRVVTARHDTCPYGASGDRLWVRETWGQANGVWEDWEYHRGKADRRLPVVWKADNPTHGADDEYWRPSIHMPRWASRITLEVTCVRAERLQHIDTRDVYAEGCCMYPTGADVARDRFRVLWDRINGMRPGCSWNENPHVWVIEFRIPREPSQPAAPRKPQG